MTNYTRNVIKIRDSLLANEENSEYKNEEKISNIKFNLILRPVVAERGGERGQMPPTFCQSEKN